MLRKLMKHEFRATGRALLPFFGAMLLLGVLTRPSCALLDRSDMAAARFLSGGILGLYIAALCSGGYVIFFQSVGRFRRKLLGREGYLMLTLPATRSQHILARLLTSLIWYAAAAVCALLSLGLAFLGNAHVDFILSPAPTFSELTDLIKEAGPALTPYLLVAAEIFVIVVLALAVLTVIVYAGGALGASFRKHKSLLSCIFVFLFVYLMSFASIFVSGGVLDSGLSIPDNTISAVLFCGGIGILCELAVGAIFFFLTRYLLTHKLNLE